MYDTIRTWADVDLDRLEGNYRNLRAAMGAEQKFLAVVKADAYGHGALRVAALMQELGCDYLAVACLEEAVNLRRSGITLPILILGVTPPREAQTLVDLDITQAVTTLCDAQALAGNISRGRLRAHLKLDTGMGRLGFLVPRQLEQASQALALDRLDFEGVFMHFAVSDEPTGDAYTDRQLHLFSDAVAQLESRRGARFAIRHCANSGSVLYHPSIALDMARPGLALYGCYPSGMDSAVPLQPVMSLRSRIVQIRTMEPGDTVSYGRTYTLTGAKRIGVVAIGYADGLHRALSNRAQMLVRGTRCDQVGRICMDMCMLDLSAVPDAVVGDSVTIFGYDGDVLLPVDEQAEKAGTISYELMCALANRVHRVYYRHGEMSC